MKWLLASRNRGKLRDFQVLFDDFGYELIGLADLDGLPDVVEDGDTFTDNAMKKAIELYQATGLPTIGDDSGLAVDALSGAPGVYSARYAGEPSNDEKNNAKLLEDMKAYPDSSERAASFVCVLAVARDGEEPWTVEGHCHGTVAFEPKGENGFGYDPLFLTNDHPGFTMAELSPEQKAAISHRGAAMRKLVEELKKRGG